MSFTSQLYLITAHERKFDKVLYRTTDNLGSPEAAWGLPGKPKSLLKLLSHRPFLFGLQCLTPYQLLSFSLFIISLPVYVVSLQKWGGGDLATAKDILVANNTVMLELNLIP